MPFWKNRKFPLCCGFSNFTQRLSVKDIEELMDTDEFNYLIIKSDDCYFGFNLLDEVERGCIFSIINSKSTHAVDGWLVSMSMPEWVGDHSDWMTYERQVLSKTWNESPPVSGIKESEDDDDKSSVSSFGSDDDDYLPVSSLNDRKIRSSKIIQSTDTEDEVEFEGDNSKASCDWACEGRCIPGLSPVKCQYSGGCNKFVHHVCTIEWATENFVEVDSIAILCRDHHREYQAFIKSHSEKMSEYDFGNTKTKPIDKVSYSSHKSRYGEVDLPQEYQGKGKKVLLQTSLNVNQAVLCMRRNLARPIKLTIRMKMVPIMLRPKPCPMVMLMMMIVMPTIFLNWNLLRSH